LPLAGGSYVWLPKLSCARMIRLSPAHPALHHHAYWFQGHLRLQGRLRFTPLIPLSVTRYRNHSQTPRLRTVRMANPTAAYVDVTLLRFPQEQERPRVWFRVWTYTLSVVTPPSLPTLTSIVVVSRRSRARILRHIQAITGSS
jgi:hypothetical protein